MLSTGSDDNTEALTRSLVAVNAGGFPMVDSGGQRFTFDSGFEGGNAVTLQGAVATEDNAALYSSAREGKSFIFSSRVPNGRYTLSLYFADDRSQTRRFDVRAEDLRISSSWRVPTGVVTIERKFNVEVTDGRLSLGFEAVAGQAIVSGIQLTPGASIFPSSIEWEDDGATTLDREEAQSFVFEDRLYVLGGYFNTPEFEATQRFERFDPANNSWTRLGDIPTKLTHTGVAVDEREREVWFIGGFIGDFPAPPGTATVWKYDIDADTWSKGPSIPAARGAGGAAIVGRKLYYFGGANKFRTADSGSHWALDLDNPTKWRERAPLPNARNHFGTVVVNDQIYVIGGQHLLELDSINQADLHRYDVTTDEWTALASLPRQYSHFTFTTAVFNSRYIILAGGESPHDVARSDSLTFDTRRNMWGELTPLPGDRRAPAGGIINGRMYVVGGYDRSVGQTTSVFSAELLPAFT